MKVSDLFTMIGGLAFFLYGMHLLGEALAKASGSKMEALLAKMTNNPLKGVLLGACITAVIQSSSATTVMVVGFVNSGLMQLEQAVGMIMGANIGTTITSWLLSLAGIEDGHTILTLFKPETFSPVLAMAGIVLLMAGKTEKKKNAGSILLGFSILMFGMNTMSSAVKPLGNIPKFSNLFVRFSNPVMGIIAGTILTALIQSSSASVGILQALCMTGAIPYSAVLPIIMGQNIGTCITALISSIGAKPNAKRAAFLHLYFNLIGTVLFMSGFYAIQLFYPFAFLEEAATPAGIAMTHSFFNLFATLVLLPFSGRLVRLAHISVPTKTTYEAELPVKRLAPLSNMDKRFLDNPALALRQCRKTTDAMITLALETVRETLALLCHYQPEKAEYVEALENDIDKYEDCINDYLFRISHASLSESNLLELTMLQHCVGDIERIADYALSITIGIRKIEKKNLHFSKEAKEELHLYGDIIFSLLKYTIEYWENPAPITANNIRQLENDRNRIAQRILKNHKKRLKKGKCSVNMGFLLSDVLSGLDRIAKHSRHIVDSIQDFSME